MVGPAAAELGEEARFAVSARSHSAGFPVERIMGPGRVEGRQRQRAGQRRRLHCHHAFSWCRVGGDALGEHGVVAVGVPLRLPVLLSWLSIIY